MASAGTTLSQAGGMPDRYAAALYGLADEQGALDAAVADMETLQRLVERSADFRRLIGSPLIDIMQARRAVLAVLEAEGIGKTVHDFVGVIASNRRLAALPQIIVAFAALVAQKRGVVTASITSAHPLTEVQRQSLRARLIEAGYGRVNMQETVDPSLLGGLVVKIGARLYDSSLKSRLQRLQYAMKGAA